ncbi:hypothetical protein POM88_001354 [Heracleum sosnowskyi]|uniref:Protein kinase domain-containing protein n=1 Tax=Heracleum sosnowskyi TaxID=360622 RepID=A0AAD8N9K7_9APIA|nr:hypothetical protein POM88_001354 [Heracleum sosnowskyi]
MPTLFLVVLKFSAVLFSRYRADIARGVGELHAAGVVYMNIKPSNILLDASARAVVSDYGLPLILKKSTCLKSGSESDPPEFIHVWTVPCSVRTTLLQRHGSQ